MKLVAPVAPADLRRSSSEVPVAARHQAGNPDDQRDLHAGKVCPVERPFVDPAPGRRLIIATARQNRLTPHPPRHRHGPVPSGLARSAPQATHYSMARGRLTAWRSRPMVVPDRLAATETGTGNLRWRVSLADTTWRWWAA